MAVHIRKKGDWQFISEWYAIQSDVNKIRQILGQEPDCTAEIANVSSGQKLMEFGKYMKIVGESKEIVCVGIHFVSAARRN